MPASKNSKSLPIFDLPLAAIALAAVSIGAVAWFSGQGSLYYYGDAEAHLNIARRVVDSRTPGYCQIGTVWLPLPHALMMPLVRLDDWWRSGLAGSVPSSACFVIAGIFLYAGVRRAFEARAPAVAAVSVFALNPNLLYLQSTAMTEPVLFAALAGVLYFTVRFRQTQSTWCAVGAGVASLAGSLARYEAWFLFPFVALCFLVSARRKSWWMAAVFGVLASLGPLYWLAHNWWCYGDVLEFYRGPYSAKAIYQRSLDAGMVRYPGDGDWEKAFLYFRTAARLCAGSVLFWLGLAGLAAALGKRVVWPVLLLALPPVFYIWSIYSSGTPIFVPELWPNTYYNTRYGLALLPLLALGAGALVAVAPGRWRAAAATVLIGAAVSPWVLSAKPESWICWKESQTNSQARRVWTREAAEYLRARYRGGGIMTSFGDMAGIFRQAGIPFREILHEGNVPHWEAAVARPDLFMTEEWAVAISADKVSTAILRSRRNGPHYRLVKTIVVKGAPVIEIYRRDS